MGIRTPDLLNAIEALYQLSYDPKRSNGSHAKAHLDGGVTLGRIRSTGNMIPQKQAPF